MKDRGARPFPPVRDVYTRNLEDAQAEAAATTRRARRLSNARLAVFALGLLAMIWIFRSRPGSWPWTLLPLAGFVLLVVLHGRARRRRERALRVVAHAERGLARIDGRAQGPTGSTWRPPEHPFADDLDLFGPGSLFPLVGATRTALGQAVVARWLTEPSQADAIRRRQQAVTELVTRRDLREQLALAGRDEVSDVDADALEAWAASPPAPMPGAVRVAAVVLALLAVAATVAWLAFGAGLGPLALLAVAEALFGRLALGRHEALAREAARAAGDLSVLRETLDLLERGELRTDALVELRTSLTTQSGPPSAAVARLERILGALESGRRNAFYGLPAFLLQLRVHQIHALATWQRETGPAVPRWLAAAGAFEALCALATYADEHPDHVLPEILDEGPRFHAQALGHVLLLEPDCVRNDVALDTELRLVLISGSNMSGKSTLLRAVGINAVLAMAGAPVRARRLSLSPFALGASLRIQDSLQEGASRFFAEIRRLRAIDELTSGPWPVLFLLDEILQGTNSSDRLAGASAVVRRLVERGAVGLVTTHDLALARIAEDLAPHARNAHFEDELRDGRLHFDYTLRPGVVERGNALNLMRSLGLEV